jgi:hypothetical protein
MGEGIWKKSVNLPRGLDRHAATPRRSIRSIILVFYFAVPILKD